KIIKSHAKLGENVIFEIKWKLGDVTWMLYYQIKHLQALEEYFSLLGVNSILELP
ncbi:hypothetical protein BYT27DRAFT_7054347, partial [Phlegmacium glaucopus]